MSELDVLTMVKMVRLNRLWMNKHATKRQRELNNYFDEYTLHSGHSDDDNRPPEDGIPPIETRVVYNEQKLEGSKVGYIGLKTVKLETF